MTIKSCFSLVEEAKQKIKSINFKNAMKLHNEGETIFIDLRDVRELEKNGKIKNAKHVPRGMLEFWIDPKSPYYRDYFSSKNKFIFYCASGWRSSLSSKTALEMGLINVFNLEISFFVEDIFDGFVSCPFVFWNLKLNKSFLSLSKFFNA